MKKILLVLSMMLMLVSVVGCKSNNSVSVENNKTVNEDIDESTSIIVEEKADETIETDEFYFLPVDKDVLKYKEITVDNDFLLENIFDVNVSAERYAEDTFSLYDDNISVSGIGIYGIYWDMLEERYSEEINNNYNVVLEMPKEIDGKEVVSFALEDGVIDKYRKELTAIKIPDTTVYLEGGWKAQANSDERDYESFEGFIGSGDALLFAKNSTFYYDIPRNLKIANSISYVCVNEDNLVLDYIRMGGISVLGTVDTVIIKNIGKFGKYITIGEHYKEPYTIKNVIIEPSDFYNENISENSINVYCENLIIKDGVDFKSTYSAGNENIGFLVGNKIKTIEIGKNVNNVSFSFSMNKGEPIEKITISTDLVCLSNLLSRNGVRGDWYEGISKDTIIVNKSGGELNWNNIFDMNNDNAIFASGRLDFGKFYIDITEE